MGVVLRETADAGQAVELAGLFPAVNGAELGEAHREVAVAVRLGREDLDVMGAVHRFQHETVEEFVVRHHAVGRDGFLAGAGVDLGGEVAGDGVESRVGFGAGAAFGEGFRERFVFEDRRELRIFVVGEMAGGLVELELADVWREDLRVALLAELAADEVLQLLADDRAVGRPEDEALADVFVDVEKLQFLAEFAVVAGLGLLGALEVLREFFLGRKRGAVDALELLVFLVAAVIRAGDGEELEGFQFRGIAHVRAGAEIHELAVLVERNFFALGNVGETAEFVALLAARLDDLDGLLAGDLLAVKALVFIGDLFHLGLELHEVVGGEFVIEVDVVVEPGVRGRTDVELGIGEDAEDGGREDVRGRVAEFFERSHDVGHSGKELSGGFDFGTEVTEESPSARRTCSGLCALCEGSGRAVKWLGGSDYFFSGSSL